MYFLEKASHYSVGTTDGFSFHILKFQGHSGKRKCRARFLPTQTSSWLSKINSGPIVCIHLLPTRKSSLSNIARGERKSRGQKKHLQSRPGSVNPSPGWLYSQWQRGWAREKSSIWASWLCSRNIIQRKLFPIWARVGLVWPGEPQQGTT